MVVFEGLAAIGWGDLFALLLRDSSYIADACDAAMTVKDHHDWISEAAKRLTIGSAPLWHAMCAEWVKRCMKTADYERVEQYVEDRLAEPI